MEDRVDHYLDILAGIMGRDRFEQAVRAPDVIRYLLKALYDPVHGDDVFSHRALHGAARRMHERKSAPVVSDPDLERMLGGVVANRARTFDEIMAGVANRLEKIPADQRLATIFNHVHEADDDARFDLADYLNEDVVIVVDTGGLRTGAQRVLTLVLLSNLWTALRRRARRAGGPALDEVSGAEDAAAAVRDRDHPLVNLYLEEAASVAVSELLQQLLAQSRGFDCSVTLSMQFPAQLRDDEGVYDELLNNISTFVTGNVPVDRELTQRLATADEGPEAVSNRLRALRRGQWLVSLPAPFDEPEPRLFLLESADPPPGDPAGSRPLTDRQARSFFDRLQRVRERTRREAGLQLSRPSPAAGGDGADSDESSEGEERDGDDETVVRVDTALPRTRRMPPTVRYDAAIDGLRCTECDNRYDPSTEGMRRAIECCSSLESVDRDDVPICDLNLKLTPEERTASEWSDDQLLFLQAVYNAQQLRYDQLEYDIVTDSMLRLQEYVGIGSDAVQDLLDADVLRHDTDHSHRLFTVTPEGRDVIGESYREGVDYGYGAGDLEESSQHVFAVEVARRYLIVAHRDDPDSDVTAIVPYYEIDAKRRLDCAGIDDESEVVVAVEAERVNNDVLRAVPDDYDKIVDSDPEEAIVTAVNRGGDADTIGAIAGAVAGARFGAGNPPERWLSTIDERDELARLANQLSAL